MEFLPSWPIEFNTMISFSFLLVAGAMGFKKFDYFDAPAGRYRKIVLHDNRLTGIFSIDVPFDAGVMVELVLRRVDLGPVKQAFLDDPRLTARTLMSKLWR